MITQAMRPEKIDYSMIDPPLRSLVESINGSPWARTAGCCGGNACHESGNFYLLVRVKGIEGVRNFLRWLGLSRSLGWEACIGNPEISAYALPDAEIVGLDGPEDDDNWITFDLRFRLGDGQPGRGQTLGGIKALETGWEALTRGGVYEAA